MSRWIRSSALRFRSKALTAWPKAIRWLYAQWIPRSEVRAEIWALGCRHGGEALQGARTELSAPGLSVRRKVLLKTVIRDLET